MQRGMLRAIAAFRWGAWVWMAIVLALNRGELRRAWLAWALVALTLAFTVAVTLLGRARSAGPERSGLLLLELLLGAALGVCGGWAYRPGDAFSSVRTIGSAWPLAGILSTGVTSGPWAGALAGLAISVARWFAPLAGGIGFGELERSHVFSLASTTLLNLLAGAVAGHAASLLRRAENEVAAARAREDVARTLHDGVLQTLAIIERRAGDPALARLAREQERDLRAFLFGSVTAAGRGGAAEIGPALHAAAARFEEVFGGRVDVVLAPDLPPLDENRTAALVGAVGEALTNAGKHGAARRVTVYAEPAEEGGIRCSVRDDGAGFDPAATREGVGLSRSIRGRMEDADGRAEIESRPGGGTEVRMWLP